MTTLHETEETIRITFKGLLSIYLLNEKTVMEVYNAIELSCRRNNWGIAIDESNRLDFVPIMKVEETE
jgi:hypothetical protein